MFLKSDLLFIFKLPQICAITTRKGREFSKVLSFNYLKQLLIISLFLLYNLISIKGENKVYVSDKNKKDGLLSLEESKRLLELDYNKIYSSKKLGSYVENGKTIFRLFAPSAKEVRLVTFKQPEQEEGHEYEMIDDKDGVWEASIDGELYGTFYGYKVFGEETKRNNTICLDPYAKAVTTLTDYMNPRKAIVVKDGEYNWEGDSWIQRDWRDLIVYEMHIKDMTAHPSSGVKNSGTYQGLIEKNKKGGIDYIKSLGVNTVELLPAQEFASIEIPYKKYYKGRHNTWNPYERNHWGYMTASFFAPAALYSENQGEFQWNTWIGKDARQVNDFKDMVKAFHKEGIAVIMDVVYNHISEYELGNLKEVDYKYYFRLDENGNFKSESGCGNDFKSERLMSRRMIIESVLYWMKEYHVDGFRFDLGKLIDWETIEEIIREARNVNPNVVFVCEPWGGGYDPAGFSLRGWGSWNDQIRNGVKGENPYNGHGWIFGKWYGNNDKDRIKSYVNGTLVRDRHGLFQKKDHSVNYLESHDGYTLGDFIRIAAGEVNPNKIIKDVDENAKLSETQFKLNKLAALFLLTSQGSIMISEGQEFARSKVVPYDGHIKDTLRGKIDHNSYNKDDETNYINYWHSDINKELVDYYRGLIELRKKHDAFRRAKYEEISFFEIPDNQFVLAYRLNSGKDEFIVLLNADNHQSIDFNLPEGNWNITVSPEKSGVKTIKAAAKKITAGPKEGFVLKKSD